MAQGFESLSSEQKQAFRERLAKYGFNPDEVLRNGGGSLWRNTTSIREFKRLLGPPEGAVQEPPPPNRQEGTATQAEGYVFFNRPTTDDEIYFFDQQLGPYSVQVAALPDLVIDEQNPLILEGGAQVREYGKITLKPGGRIEVRDCFAKITCQVLEKTA
ncbi:MAG TPA: hypothetical protein VMW27_22855 [Thermoanaerobaculia bacterium]|nr:hypothetical protein [Thermoanaerobaculia bacterium]